MQENGLKTIRYPMKKGSLAPYFLLSFIIHASFLIGAHQFLKLPAKEVEPTELIPVEIVVIEEKIPALQPTLAISEQILTPKVLKTKSQTSTTTRIDRYIEDMPEPVPAEVNDVPRFTVESVPTMGVIPSVLKGQNAGSRPIVDIPEMPSLQLSPVDPSAPMESSPSEMKAPTDLVEARAEISPAYPRTPEKIRAPWERIRPSAEIVLAPQPTANEFSDEPRLTIESIQTLGAIPAVPKGQRAASRPIVETIQMSPLHFSPIDPSAPMESSPAEMKVPTDLVEANAEFSPAHPRTPEKIEAPRERIRPSTELVSELSPILAVGSPSISERIETIMALAVDLLPERSMRTATQKGFISTSRTSIRMAQKKDWVDQPIPIAPNAEPAALIFSRFRFPGSEKGAAYLFLIDTSGSVKGTPLDGIKKSAKEFATLMGQNDRAGIMTFNDDVELVRSFTAERRAVKHEIDMLRTAGKQTVLFDALIRAIDIISREYNENRFIVLISDGKDEGSHSTLDDVIQATRRSGVSILSIGYSKIQKEYLAVLRGLAGQTGGDFVHAPEFNDVLALYRMSRDTGTEKSVKSPSLQVKSDPIGAQVYVDGSLKGETPLHLELSIGKHDVLLILPDHHDWKATILLEEGGEVPLYVRLLPVE